MGDWRYHLAGLAPQDRAKAVRAYELAAEKIAGEQVEQTAAALRTAAAAEGLATADAWIDAAAVELSQDPHRRRSPASAFPNQRGHRSERARFGSDQAR